MPVPIFGLVLVALAALWFRIDPFITPAEYVPLAAMLSFFFFTDWALLAALPRAGRSYGPPKPAALMLAVLRMSPAWLPLPWNILAQIAGTALVVYGFWIEPQRISVTRQSLTTAKFKPSRALRVLHLSDLHVERMTARERQLLDLVRELAPDLIVFTGDFLNIAFLNDPDTRRETRALLKELHAPLGVYAVTGSPAVDRGEAIAPLLKGLPIRWLRNERVTLEYEGAKFDLIGMACTHKPFEDVKILDALVPDKPERLAMLLYHSPDLAPEAASRGIDLQLSGHTHGGQVRLPFIGALYTASLYGKVFEAGRYAVNGMTLYISRGLGMEGAVGAPRVRFLCPPEIVLWEIGEDRR